MIGRASSAVPPPAAVSPERTGVSDPAPETSVPMPVAPAVLSPQHEEGDPVVGTTTNDAAPVSTDSDNVGYLCEADKPTKHYQVTFHQWIHAESDLEVDLTANADSMKGDKAKQPTHFVDVLLQVDAHGIGINLSAQRCTVGLETNSCSRLVVISFRRLHAHDVGPAEACQQIRVGDELVSIDGEPLYSLERLLVKMKSIRKNSFVLVRLVRHTFEDAKHGKLIDPIGSTDNNEVLLEEETNMLKFDTLLQSNAHAAAVMMRDLVRRNQALQEQLMANKLQQAEQSIQLDQLHALYARTQLDNFPSFSFPKSIRPFLRYPSAAGDSDGTAVTSSSIAPVVKPTGTLKLHADIELAIHEERIKLRREYARQLEFEKNRIAKQYADQSRAVQQAMQKKIEMLEAGFQRTIDEHLSKPCQYFQPLQNENKDDDESGSCCALQKHIQQDLLYQHARNHSKDQSVSTACTLPAHTKRTSIGFEMDCLNGARVQNIVSIIRNYDRLVNVKIACVEGSPDCANQPKVIEQLTPDDNDPLQP